MIIVSACLLGFNCRYDGQSRPDEDLLSSALRKLFVPVCPEQLGGLSTPRVPSEIISGDGLDVLEGKSRILSSSGSDVTDCFLRGANEVMRLVALLEISTAIMKEKKSVLWRLSYKKKQLHRTRIGCHIGPPRKERNPRHIIGQD